MADSPVPPKRKKVEQDLDKDFGVSDVCDKFLQLEEKLCDDLDCLSYNSELVSHVYNPLIYARATHEDYIRKYCRGEKKIMFLGMNPGPFGMAQNGVPFGDTNHVKKWLRIQGKVNKPTKEHPKRPIEGLDCKRSEVSGSRFWGFFKDQCKTPETFFRNCFVHNYCPLVFMAKSGKNITPPQLRVSDKKESLFKLCDKFLADVIQLLQVDFVVGVGKFALVRAQAALKDLDVQVCVDYLMHPSPVNPASNKGWDKIALQQLSNSEVMCYISGEVSLK